MFSRVKHPCQRPPCYFAWGCFRYFSWEREPRRPCGCLSRDDRRVACRAVARVQRSPPSPAGLWRGSLRYEMACPAGQTARWRRGRPPHCWIQNVDFINLIISIQSRGTRLYTRRSGLSAASVVQRRTARCNHIVNGPPINLPGLVEPQASSSRV